MCVFSVLISSACLLKLASRDEMCWAAVLPELLTIYNSPSLCQGVTPQKLMRHLILAREHLKTKNTFTAGLTRLHTRVFSNLSGFDITIRNDRVSTHWL